MYCKYCGKPIPADAKYCGFCGKMQETKYLKAMKSNISIQSLIYTIISFLIQATIIILSFTNVIKISFGDGYLRQIILVNVFDFFDGSNYFNQLGNIIPDLLVLSEYARIAGIMIIVAIGICIIYLVYVMMLYIPNINMENKCKLGIEHHKHSVVAPMIYIFVVTIVIIFISQKGGNFITVVPSNKMIAIYILTGIQFAVNIICHKKADSNSVSENAISDEEPIDPTYIALRTLGIALAIILISMLALWLHLF